MSMFGENTVNPNRYLCSVIDEMRTQLKLLDTHNIDRYKSIMGLMIEECQTLGNRMEAALEDAGDIQKLLEQRAKLKKELRKLRTEKSELLSETGEDDG